LKITKILTYLLGSAISILICLLTLYFVQKSSLTSYNTAYEYFGKTGAEGGTTVEVEIPEGSGLNSVANILYEKKLISNKFIFILESYVKRESSGFQPGVFKLTNRMTPSKIREVLSATTPSIRDDEIVVVVKEGFTLRQTAELLEYNGICGMDAFLAACETETFDYDFFSKIPERTSRLEGYLFPDTYYFTENMEPRAVIDKFLERFDEKFDDRRQARVIELGTSIDDIVKIASIVEKEISAKEERELSASVIYNRLNKGMPLEMDSTIVYALGKHINRVVDTSIDSPYNTYQNLGLPYGPISNPGIACIDAALFPAETNYLYYVVNNREAGTHFFTDDYNAFVNAKNEYISQFDE
jgi:UPF0755 protein